MRDGWRSISCNHLRVSGGMRRGTWRVNKQISTIGRWNTDWRTRSRMKFNKGQARGTLKKCRDESPLNSTTVADEWSLQSRKWTRFQEEHHREGWMDFCRMNEVGIWMIFVPGYGWSFRKEFIQVFLWMKQKHLDEPSVWISSKEALLRSNYEPTYWVRQVRRRK